MALSQGQSLNELALVKKQLLEGVISFQPRQIPILRTLISYGGPAAQRAAIALAHMSVHRPAARGRVRKTRKSKRKSRRNRRRVKRKTRSRR